MSIENIIYFTLQLIMLTNLYKGGKSVRAERRPYWHGLLFSIIIFTLNEGLRFGRGIDYNLYVDKYKNIISGDEVFEPLFTLMVKLFGSLNLPWQAFVVLMSFGVIYSGCKFLKSYRDKLYIILPLYAINVIIAENLMRWFLGFSFILIGMSFLITNSSIIEKQSPSYKKFIFFSFLGCLCHYGLIPIVFIILFISVQKKVLLPPYISIPIYFITLIAANNEILLGLAGIINLLPLGERMSSYQDNIEIWLTGGYASLDELPTARLSATILLTYLIYTGYKLQKEVKSKEYIFAYNLFLIGYITYPISQPIEIAFRYNTVFIIFQCIIFGYVIHYYLLKKKVLNKLLFLIGWIIVLNYIRIYIIDMPLFTNPNQVLYIWDANGRESLPFDIYKTK